MRTAGKNTNQLGRSTQRRSRPRQLRELRATRIRRAVRSIQRRTGRENRTGRRQAAAKLGEVTAVNSGRALSVQEGFYQKIENSAPRLLNEKPACWRLRTNVLQSIDFRQDLQLQIQGNFSRHKDPPRTREGEAPAEPALVPGFGSAGASPSLPAAFLSIASHGFNTSKLFKCFK